MTDNTPTILRNFSDIYKIAEIRCNISTSQDRERNLIKGAVNEAYQSISAERPWRWKSFDRDIVFKRAETDGTAAITNGSRIVPITGLTLDKSYLGRSIKFDSGNEIYRIIGVNTTSNNLYLASQIVISTEAEATYKIFKYEFMLPPDCHMINGIYTDTSFMTYGRSFPDLIPLNNEDFNRLISTSNHTAKRPRYYTRDGFINFSDAVPLSEHLLNYDFLGAYELTGERLRIFPIEPDQDRILHMSYGREVVPLSNDEDIPLIPVSERWLLVHWARYIYLNKNGSLVAAKEALGMYNDILDRMRAEFHKTDRRMKMINPISKYNREHYVDFIPTERFRSYD